MKLPHISVSGDAFEIGVALGRQGRRAYQDVVRNIDRFQSMQRWRGSDRLAEIAARSRREFPELMREVDGIAEGVEADFEEVFVWNCRGDLPGASAIAGAQGCTDVMIPADPVAGQPAVIGHNEDDAPMLADECFVATVTPSEGLGFTSFCSPGLLPGHTFAVNEAGLVQTINHIRPADQQAGIGRHIISRAVLGCRTLDAARTVLERTDRASGFHHNLGSCKGMTLWAVEAPASGCAIEPVAAPYAHANHLVFERFSDLDQEVARSSHDRQRRANALIASGAVDRDPLAILGDREGDGLPICRKTRGGPDSGYTLATAVFEIGAEGVAWRVYDDPNAAPVLDGTVIAERPLQPAQ